jgi:hypothetical protein
VPGKEKPKALSLEGRRFSAEASIAVEAWRHEFGLVLDVVSLAEHMAVLDRWEKGLWKSDS